MDRGHLTKSILIGVLVSLLNIFSIDFWSAIGLGFVSFISMLYLFRLGNTIPLLELLTLIASSQWIVGAHISYISEYQHFKYYMYTDRELYMEIIVPGLICFFIGICLFYPNFDFKRVNLGLRKVVEDNPRLPLVLILLGVLSSFLQGVLPPAFSFIIFLLSNFRFVGAALWLFRPGKMRSLWATITVLTLIFISSLRTGLFHDFLLWAALLLTFVVLRLQLGMIWRVVLMTAGIAIALLIQSVKFEYRSILYHQLGADSGGVEAFSGLAQQKLSNIEGLAEDERFLGELNVRLNQGWVISAIINNVPSREPFAEGRSISEAIQATLLPRFLAPDKKAAGGRQNFEQFTGLRLHENTSMGVSVVGEAYANFGKTGSWIFMFLWGVFLAWAYGILVKYGVKRPVIFVFIPLIFLQVIKAETELYVVLNHFVKSILLVFILLFFARKFLSLKI